MALSVTLFLGVEKARDGARSSFERTISGTDLIVGARSGPLNLLLYSVFHLGDATANITWESYQDLARHPAVAWTVPISLGDSHRGFRVVGTNEDFFRHYQYGGGSALSFADGRQFEGTFDVVLGATVASELGYELGHEIIVSHGLGQVSFSDHSDNPFQVSGILAPTGTPVDRTVMVSLEAIEAIHIGWESGAPSTRALAGGPSAIQDADLQPDQITAFYVGLNSRIAVLGLQRDINTYDEEPLLAVLPGVALGQMWSVVSVVERFLAGLSVFVIFVGLLTILTSILTSLNERRREMAVLRSVGARPWHIFALLVAESGLLAFLGTILAFVFLYGGLVAVAPLIETRYGFALADIGPGQFDLIVAVAVPAASCLLGMVPGWRAFRRSLADGLEMRV